MPEKSFLSLHRYKYAHFPLIRVMYDLHQKQQLTPPQQALMASRLPKEELYDIENDPYEITNLVDSPDPDHQRVLSELRAELNRWMEETKDQGVQPESPSVIDYWVQDAARRHGTPDWYDPIFGATEQTEQ